MSRKHNISTVNTIVNVFVILHVVQVSMSMIEGNLVILLPALYFVLLTIFSLGSDGKHFSSNNS